MEKTNMQYPKMLKELSTHQWAITHDAFDSILSVLKDGFVSVNRFAFHSADETEMAVIKTNLGQRVKETTQGFKKGSVGTLLLDGPIIPRGDSFSRMSGLVSIDTLTDDFKAFEKDDEINTIILYIDSPGGAVTGVSDLAQLIAKCPKTTMAFVYGRAASAAYWIASSTDKIISSNTGLVGSVGTVISVQKNNEENMEVIVSKQSPKKVPDVNTKEGKKEFQTIVDDISDVFVAAVASGRKQTTETVLKDFGQGAIMIASKGLKNKMIDGIGTLDDFMKSVVAGQFDESMFKQEAAISSPEPAPKLKPRKQNKNKIHKGNKSQTTKGQKMKTLQASVSEILALESPTAHDVTQILTEFGDNMREAGRAEEKERVASAIPILESDKYAQPIKNVAVQVLKGDEPAATLKATMAAYDALNEDKKADVAAEETTKQGDTPPQNPEAKPVMNDDGTVADEDAMKAHMNGLMGRSESEVN